ncbi:hypothetical protein V6N12_040644 [Hibiscus sabdariffa]|uniref:Uncharacterized protein n=1 Tax=Hibiscus sabdariffa TaxID=183260 RepID=A0ABR2E4D9_9ROSI
MSIAAMSEKVRLFEERRGEERRGVGGVFGVHWKPVSYGPTHPTIANLRSKFMIAHGFGPLHHSSAQHNFTKFFNVLGG